MKALLVLLACSAGATTLLPVVLVLAPEQIREAAWNGFLPSGIPPAVWVGVLSIPTAAAAAWVARRGSATGPLGSLVLAVGCGLAVIAGAGIAVRTPPSCNVAQFEHFSLACDRASGWP